MTLSEAIDRYSADGMRLALADAGDSVEDANFDVANAEAGILRLYTFILWVKEMLEDSDQQLRQDQGVSNFHDDVFANEMNKLCHATAAAYDRLLFREALRNGFFEMQRSRDKYRELCGSQGMRRDLVLRFIEWQAVVISPICPHVAEKIWTLLGKKESILKARWPNAGNVDEVCIKKSEYLMEAVRDFRLKLKSYMQPPKTKKGGSAVKEIEKPTHATIYVAKTYPPWQCIVLSTLKDMYETSGGVEQPPNNKLISQELGKKSELKKWMKKVMPFVQFTKERVAQSGLSILDLTLEFDEKDVLMNNMDYILSSLQLEGVDVKFSTEAGEKTQEECRPGAPFVLYRHGLSTLPNVKVNFINNQPHSGLFSIKLPIMDGDSVSSVARRLANLERNIKDHAKVKLYRYEDPILGPRKIPSAEDPMEGKVQIQEGELFSIDVDKDTVSISKSSIGSVIYVTE